MLGAPNLIGRSRRGRNWNGLLMQARGRNWAGGHCGAVRDEMRARGNDLPKSSAAIVRSFKLAK